MGAYATGGNFEITLTRGIAICTVWMRPDVTREEGQLRTTEGNHPELICRAVPAPWPKVCLDLRRAPTKWGPRTQEALEEIFTAWGVSPAAISASLPATIPFRR